MSDAAGDTGREFTKEEMLAFFAAAVAEALRADHGPLGTDI
ncbi:MAG: hypothetical protein OXE75_09080 [bacterium]|nr:hypothetical protein [bacterium]